MMRTYFITFLYIIILVYSHSYSHACTQHRILYNTLTDTHTHAHSAKHVLVITFWIEFMQNTLFMIKTMNNTCNAMHNSCVDSNNNDNDNNKKVSWCSNAEQNSRILFGLFCVHNWIVSPFSNRTAHRNIHFSYSLAWGRAGWKMKKGVRETHKERKQATSNFACSFYVTDTMESQFVSKLFAKSMPRQIIRHFAYWILGDERHLYFVWRLIPSVYAYSV